MENRLKDEKAIRRQDQNFYPRRRLEHRAEAKGRSLVAALDWVYGVYRAFGGLLYATGDRMLVSSLLSLVALVVGAIVGMPALLWNVSRREIVETSEEDEAADVAERK